MYNIKGDIGLIDEGNLKEKEEKNNSAEGSFTRHFIVENYDTL